MSHNSYRIINVPIEWGKLGTMVTWCEHNCVGEWRYTCVEPAGVDAGRYEFHFDNDRDFVKFTMWQS